MAKHRVLLVEDDASTRRYLEGAVSARPGCRLTVDRGALTPVFAVLGVAAVMAVMLVVDGGRALGALSEARDIADNAARAGTQAVDEDAWRDTGRPVLQGLGQVNALIDQYEIDSGLAARPNATVVARPSTGPDADITVTAEATVTIRGFLIGTRTVTATETATAIDGVTG